VAVGLARLGVAPLLLARSGSDAFAATLDAHLSAAGLARDGVVPAEGPSAVAVVTRRPDGSAHYDLYLAGVPDLAWTTTDLDRALGAATGAACWHTGSLASWSGPGWSVVLDAFRRARADGRMVLSYDPNARPGLEPLAEVARRVAAYVATADVVKVSDEDLALLYPQRDPDDVCAGWADSGPGLVVLTRGSAGVSAWRPGRNRLDVPGVQVAVSDTVGAGDTLTAGLLAGLADADALAPRAEGALTDLADDRLAHVLARACRAAAITCSRPGADPPTRAELDAWPA
jgi:fructokinase